MVPGRFFSILASQGRAVYADALFLLYDLYRSHQFGLRRDDVVDALTDLVIQLDEAGESSDWLDDEPWEGEDALQPERGAAASLGAAGSSSAAATSAGAASLGAATTATAAPAARSAAVDPRARANAILRRLKEAGWVDLEARTNYEEYVNLMDYAIQVLDVLDRIRTRRQTEYRGFVFQTYLALTSDDALREGHLALQAAYDQTEALVRELKSLHHNIRHYTERLLQQKRPQDVLAVHFLEYQGEILSRSYHQLKTTDHVSRYRPKILAAVRSWLRDPERVKAAAGGLVAGGHMTDAREAQSEVLRRLSFIDSSYETMDELLHEIDQRNAQYAKASLEQVRYMLNSSRDTEGQLIDLLRFAAQRIAEDQSGWRESLRQEWQDLFALAAVGAVDDRSLFTPRRARELMKPEALARPTVDDETRRRALARAHAQVADRLTVERVNRQVLERMGDRAVVRAQDLGVETVNDFVLLIHTAAYSTSRKAAYQVDFEGPAVESAAGRFRFRNVTIRRKKHG
ncbi:MAG: Wadjet anti-phage system protein JetA family protein [Bacillota bacterium]